MGDDTQENSTPESSAQALQNRIDYYRKAAKAVRSEILTAYQLEPDALSPTGKRDGKNKTTAVKAAIADFIESAAWESTCNTAAHDSLMISIAPAVRIQLGEIASTMIWRFIEGMKLRSIPTHSKDPFYAHNPGNPGEESVQEMLTNLYLNHATNETLAELAALGFKDEAALSLLKKMVGETFRIVDGQALMGEHSIKPPIKWHKPKLQKALIVDYARLKLEGLQAVYDAVYPVGTPGREEGKYEQPLTFWQAAAWNKKYDTAQGWNR